ncbi:MAG: serine/threonine-protein kinase [Polyangiales bacterium]
MTEPLRSPADAWIGRVVADKYRVTGRLGVGGHGAVFEAENTWTGRRVALKVLLGAAALNAEMSERFLREARVTTRVAHPNIVEVLDMGRDPHDGSLFIVQELLQGEDLRDVLRRERTLDPRWLVGTLAPVLDALTAAHAQGVVHRDLKPANLFLARQPDGRVVPKLIDFGVSRMDDAPGATELTHAGALLGTPDYMSPEQARGERAGAQSDVWAVGVILFEALAGHRPYRAANYNALLVRILADDAPPLRSVAPDVPEALAAAVDRALARDTAVRFASAAALREALLAWAEGALNAPAPSALDVVAPAESAPIEPPPVDDPTPVSISPPAMLREPVATPTDVTDESPAAPAPPRAETLPGPDRAAAAPVPVATPATWERAPARPSSRSLAPWVFVGVATVAAATVAAAWLATRPPPPPRVVAHVAEPPPAPSAPDAASPGPAPVTADDASVAALDGEASPDVLVAVEPDVARPRWAPRPLPPPTIERPEPLEIRRVMLTASGAVAGCVNGQEGTVSVSLVILGTGAVDAVTVAPPWGTSPAGACVAAALRRLRFSRFRQARFVLAWPYVVRAPGAPELGAPLTAR